MNKKEAIKYILLKFCDWYSKISDTKIEDNDLSIMKTLNLLFLLCTIENNGESLLDKGFDKFETSSIGTIETDLYKFYINNMDIISDRKTYCENISHNLPKEDMLFIDSVCEKLRARNNFLVLQTAFHVADLSKAWECWKTSIDRAEKLNKCRGYLTIQEIKESNKIYGF